MELFEYQNRLTFISIKLHITLSRIMGDTANIRSAMLFVNAPGLAGAAVTKQIVNLDIPIHILVLLKDQFLPEYIDLPGLRYKGSILIQNLSVIYLVCTLCRDHEKAGFIEGIKIGIRLHQELNE